MSAAVPSSLWNGILDGIKKLEGVSGGGNLYGVTDGKGNLLPSEGDARDRSLAWATLAYWVNHLGSISAALAKYGEPCNSSAFTNSQGFLQNRDTGHVCGAGYAAWVLQRAGAGTPVGTAGPVQGTPQGSQPQERPAQNLQVLLVLAVAGILGFVVLIDLLKPKVTVTA